MRKTKLKTIYLYRKESPLGLKYLGQTTENPFVYSGSGKIWKRHLKKHNLIWKDIKTTVLFETTCREELKKKGIYYSELWNVVESEDWANLIPETGEHSTLGYKHTPEAIEKSRLFSLGRKHTEESKKKMSEAQKGKIKTERQKESAASVWRGKKMPDYIKKIIKEAVADKTVHIPSGEIFNSIKDAADFINMAPTSLIKYLKWAQYEHEFKYLDERLNLEAIQRRKDRDNKFARRLIKNLPNKSSIYPGVHRDKVRNKWLAQIRIGDKRKHLGRYEDEIEAKEAYEKALINFKKENYANI